MPYCHQDAKAEELRRAEEVGILEAEKARLGEILSAGARRCAELESYTQQLERKVDEVQVGADLLSKQMREKDVEISLLSGTLSDANEKGAKLELSVTEMQTRLSRLQREFSDKRQEIILRATERFSQLKGQLKHICSVTMIT